jgi:hypothetical protein
MAYSRRKATKKTSKRSSAARSAASYAGRSMGMPKGIIDGLVRAVSNQLKLGSAAASRISQETSQASARSGFAKKTTMSDTPTRALGTKDTLRVGPGSQGLTQQNFTINLSKEPLGRKLTGQMARELKRIKNDEQVTIKTTSIKADSKLSPSMQPSIPLTKGLAGSEKVPLLVFPLNVRSGQNTPYYLNPDPADFTSWAVNTYFDNNVDTPMGHELTAIRTEQAVLKYVKARVLLYGVPNRQARYRVVVFRPKGSDSMDITSYDGNSLNVGTEFSNTFFGHYMNWMKKWGTNPVSAYHTDTRLDSHFKKNFDIRLDREVVIDETLDGESSLKQVLLNVYLPAGSSGLDQDYRTFQYAALGASHENPESIEPGTTGYNVSERMPKIGQRWYMMIIASESLNETERAAGSYKQMGADVSVTRVHHCYKNDTAVGNALTVS